MSRQGLDVPVLLGGAALTRATSRTTAARPTSGRGRLRPRRLRRPAPDGRIDGRVRCDLPAPSARPSSRRGPSAAKPAQAGRDRCRRRPTLRPLEVAEIRLRRTELARGVAGPQAALLGRRGCSSGAGPGAAARTSTTTCSSSSSGASSKARPHARRVPRLGEQGAEADPAGAWSTAPSDEHVLPAAGGLRLLALPRPRATTSSLFDPAEHAREVARFTLPAPDRKTASASPTSSATSDEEPSAT